MSQKSILVWHEITLKEIHQDKLPILQLKALRNANFPVPSCLPHYTFQVNL